MQRPWQVRTTALAITLTAGLTASLFVAVPRVFAASDPGAIVASAAEPAGQSRTVEGVIRLLAADTVSLVEGATADEHAFTGPSHDVYQQVLIVGNTSYFLAGELGEPNTRVRVTGVSDGRIFTASSIQTLGPDTGSLPSKGTTNVLVMLAEWSQPDSVTPASAADQMFNDTNGWYRDASYGALGQTGDVTPWMAIDGPVDGKCYADSENIMTQAKTAATKLGYDLGSYDNYVMYFPYNGWQSGSDCSGFGGWAYVGAPSIWINGYLDRRVTSHEQGHNYGLSHSHSYLCDDVVLGDCTLSDYGDDYDAMGASGLVGHFSASQKDLLGWLDDRLVDLTAGGSVTLAPYASDDVATDAVVVKASPSRSYWLEYRQPIDYDQSLPGSATDGVLVHVKDRSISGDDGSNLIDTRPGDGVSVSTATLRSGESWKTPEGYTLRVGSVQPAGATVSVSGGPICPDARREPDNDAAEARLVDVPSKTSHAFCAAGDEDWVKFEATSGTRYRLKTVHLSDRTDTDLKLYAPDGVTLLAQNDDYYRGLASRIRFTPAISGTYYLAADQVLGRGSFDLTYKLRLTAR